MALSDSIFLLDIAVADTVSVMDYEDYIIKARLSDLFEINLQGSKEHGELSNKYTNAKKNSRKNNLKEFFPQNKIFNKYFGQYIFSLNKIIKLNSIKRHPMELSLWCKNNPERKIGMVQILWHQKLIDYVQRPSKSPKHQPVAQTGVYDVFDEKSNKCITSMKVTLMLTYTKTCPDNYLTRPYIYKYLSTTYSGGAKTIDINDKGKPTRLFQDITPTLRINKGIDRKNIKQNANKKLVVDNEKYINVRGSHGIKSFKQKSGLNPLNYIFGDTETLCRSRIYCVNYFTVDKNITSPKKSNSGASSQKSSEPNKHITLNICKSECLSKARSCSPSSINSLDIPQNIASSINMTKCEHIDCKFQSIQQYFQEFPDETILLDIRNLKNDCCNDVETSAGGNMVSNGDPCYCTCECQIKKKTKYCEVCGGHERIRKDTKPNAFPCPLYHKLIDKNKPKTWSTSGSSSRSKRKGDDSQKSIKGSSQKPSSEKRLAVTEKKSIESEKDSKKSKKKKREDRFKFNYGYKAPQIGHSHCALPCTGILGNVPKNMGWLWTAENIPGMKFRPMWKPGAANKHVVRLLRIARFPGEVLGKKKKKDSGKKKRPLKRPLLIVHKKDGEYTVTMETMKSFTRPRTINQHPYEDKPVVTYTIGRTEEENQERRNRKERQQRRLERAKRMFIQSAFQNMCREICLKTYQQALGILPNSEDPQCPCYPALPTTEITNMDISCSCSEDKSSNGSKTDSDEWVVEFTPPNALFDPLHKEKKSIKVDNGSQYTYLDYRVKLVDRFGNPVPRFFKGPDGKQQCSDLGGFWSPDHKWLQINIDGYVSPDGKWAPNTFTGPNGEFVDAETGKFQANNGRWLVVGVDGYIDYRGKWRYYPNHKRGTRRQKKRTINVLTDRKVDSKKDDEKDIYKSETTWSCFGDASPQRLSRLGITGHGKDKRFLLSKLQDMIAHGEDVKIPHSYQVYHMTRKTKGGKSICRIKARNNYEETKCKHRMPSDKGITAVNADGDKVYFRIKGSKNKRPQERLAALADRGISLSSFHAPCFKSFINTEVFKKQQLERLLMLSSKNAAMD